MPLKLAGSLSLTEHLLLLVAIRFHVGSHSERRYLHPTGPHPMLLTAPSSGSPFPPDDVNFGLPHLTETQTMNTTPVITPTAPQSGVPAGFTQLSSKQLLSAERTAIPVIRSTMSRMRRAAQMMWNDSFMLRVGRMCWC